VKPCIIIPCYNHGATVAAVALAARSHCPVIVVDDGSTVRLPELPGCVVVRLERNSGKGTALRAGFQRAIELCFTHAITMDSDGQHFADDLPEFLAAAQTQPNALIVGVRDFYAAGAPAGRRRSNSVSTFWFHVETGVRLGDTQCGFRCYPLSLTQQLKIRSGRYAFELEFMVRASWVGTPVVAVPIKCVYQPDQVRHSHFRPVADLTHITIMNIGLVLQSWFVPRVLRVAWSCGQKNSVRNTICEFFSEHAQDPLRMSLAAGLGLFFGIAPIWRAIRVDVNSSLKSCGGRRSTESGLRLTRHPLRGLLVASELAFSLMLLVGAGLLIRSFVRLQNAPLGFNTDHVLSMTMVPTGSLVRNSTSVRRNCGGNSFSGPVSGRTSGGSAA